MCARERVDQERTVPMVASRSARVPGVIKQKEECETDLVLPVAAALPVPWVPSSTATANGLVRPSEEETERARRCSRADSLGALDL